MRLLRTAVPAVLAVLGLMAGTTQPASSADPSPRDRPLTVMSFNIHHGVGVDGLLNLQRVADVIKTEGVDVVGLQEVDRHWGERSDFVDQAAWLADELDMHVVYGANLDLDPAQPGEPRRQYGTAILSERPIRDWTTPTCPATRGTSSVACCAPASTCAASG